MKRNMGRLRYTDVDFGKVETPLEVNIYFKYFIFKYLGNSVLALFRKDFFCFFKKCVFRAFRILSLTLQTFSRLKLPQL